MSTFAPRVLILGLDGATWSVLEPWLRAARLPRLAALRARGTWGVLRSTVPAITLPAWCSLMTGKNPGAHGVFAFRRLAPHGYRQLGIANATDLRSATLWDVAGAAGRKVGVVNMPPSYPLRQVNGFVVGCMLTPPGEPSFTAPPEVAAELGEYRIDAEVPRALHPEAPDYRERALAYLDALREQTRWRSRATLRLMERRAWDILGVVFYAADRVQHFFWSHLADRAPGRDASIRAAVDAVYDALDEAVGDLVTAAGPDACVIVVSDHGFAPAPSRLVRVNRWLVAQGLLARRPLWSLRRKVIRRWLPARLRSRYDTDDHILLNRARSRAWCEAMDSPGEAGVWVHVRGRYPLGCVAPGAEYEWVRRQIVDGLGALRDGDGGRVFRGVWRREELYRGPYVEEAPDVIAVCEEAYAVSMQALRADLKADRVIEPFDSATFNGHTGAHDGAGLYVFAGPPVAPLGAHREYPIESIAPTALHLLGLPVPRDMEGPVCTTLLQPDYAAAHPVTFTEDAAAPAPLVGGWTPDADEAPVAERLRSLGYLG
jgi:predicted AlkP superfamily phosphohydrolase/phosphomutase